MASPRTSSGDQPRTGTTAQQDADATEAFEPIANATDTQSLLLAQGYEYVTADSGSQRTIFDAEDDSLTSGIMHKAEIVEKLSREERKAGRAEAKAAAAAAKMAERERENQLQATAATHAARLVAERQRLQAEQDRLAPTLATSSASSEVERSGVRRPLLLAGSALLAASTVAVAAFLMLPELNGLPKEANTTLVEHTAPTASPETIPAEKSAPTPSFNTQPPTVTEQEVAVEEEVPPGTVQYAPVDAPVFESEAPPETDPVAPLPEVSPVEEPTPEETSAPAEQPTPSFAPEPTEPITAEPTVTPPVATQPPAPLEPTQPVEQPTVAPTAAGQNADTPAAAATS